MEHRSFKLALIGLCVVGFFVLLFANVVHAAGTVCQIGNGCTGTSTAPGYGKVLVGGQSGEYEYAATSSFGSSGAGTVTSVGASSPNSTLTVGGTNPVTTSGTISLDLNLANSNQWTASTTITKVLNLSNASSSLNTLGTVWIPSVTSSLAVTDSNGKVGAYGGTSCTNQFVRSLNGAGVATCNSVSLTSDITGTLGISNGGTNATSFVSGMMLAYNGTSLISTSTILGAYFIATSTTPSQLTSASTTNLTAGTSNYAVNPLNELPIYVASSTWGTGTTTITLLNNARGITWVDAVCNTSVGTLEFRLYHGTVNNVAYLNASTTANTFTFSSSNVLSTATTTFLDIGNAASAPTSLNCTLEYTYNGSS